MTVIHYPTQLIQRWVENSDNVNTAKQTASLC